MDMNPMRNGINLLADAHFIPLRDKSISKTLCKSVLEHVDSPRKVVLEMKRITADEIILVVPNVVNLGRMWLNLKKPLRKVNAGTKHIQGWDSKLISHIANATGLKVLSFEWRIRRFNKMGLIIRQLFAIHMIAILKDVGARDKTDDKY